MTCQEMRLIMGVLADDAEPSELSEQVEVHLLGCLDCRTRLAEEKRLRVTLARAAKSVALPAALSRRLEGVIAQERRGESKTQRRWPFLGVLVLSGALVFGRTGLRPEAASQVLLPTSFAEDTFDYRASDETRLAAYLTSAMAAPVVLPRPTAPGQQQQVGATASAEPGPYRFTVRYQVEETTLLRLGAASTPQSIGPTFVRGYGVTHVRWQQRGISYELVSSLPASEVVRHFANLGPTRP